MLNLFGSLICLLTGFLSIENKDNFSSLASFVLYVLLQIQYFKNKRKPPKNDDEDKGKGDLSEGEQEHIKEKENTVYTYFQ